ncbi:MAG: hypothetical protein QS748_12025 [Candidatus Endonucleobacter bathymodioli]|uniref:Uncharacterized protein n=1 Tax=Candidatus Endonucleibacter bathymodioli TaxID=539814 RepID=A0AA90NSW0_9GAMM|nr:hypothetical protein [Candidatus Endonucleobacter bathymodioli]
MNKAGERDPEMHQTKKCRQWHFCMMSHIGVDVRTWVTHSLMITAANEHNLIKLKIYYMVIKSSYSPTPVIVPQKAGRVERYIFLLAYRVTFGYVKFGRNIQGSITL